MTLEALRMAIVTCLASDASRFPGLPTSLANDVIAIVDADYGCTNLLLFVPEWTKANIRLIRAGAYDSWKYRAAREITRVIYVTGPLDDSTPEDLLPDVLAATDNPDRCDVWVVNADGSITEFEG